MTSPYMQEISGDWETVVSADHLESGMQNLIHEASDFCRRNVVHYQKQYDRYRLKGQRKKMYGAADQVDVFACREKIADAAVPEWSSLRFDDPDILFIEKDPLSLHLQGKVGGKALKCGFEGHTTRSLISRLGLEEQHALYADAYWNRACDIREKLLRAAHSASTEKHGAHDPVVRLKTELNLVTIHYRKMIEFIMRPFFP